MLCVLEHDHQLKLALSIVILPLYAFPIRLALLTLKLNKWGIQAEKIIIVKIDVLKILRQIGLPHLIAAVHQRATEFCSWFKAGFLLYVLWQPKVN